MQTKELSIPQPWYLSDPGAMARTELAFSFSFSTNCRLLASLQLAFKHREVVHELLHAGAGRSRELLGRGVIQRCGGTAEFVSAPGERASLA